MITTDRQRLHDHLSRALPLLLPPEASALERHAHPLWCRLSACGTEPWLDTGDLHAARRLWDERFAALTTNNSLLNAVVQDGTYDHLMRDLADRFDDCDADERVFLVGLGLNIHHAMRLVQRFDCRVSVELHTDLADDVDHTVTCARAVHAIDPSHFVIKVPLTPAGLIAARRLRTEDIPVNCTLGCSPRQNLIAAHFAGPSYVNVFLGRIDSTFGDNQLGGGHPGVAATLASQSVVAEARRLKVCATRQIAASMRGVEHVRRLAGVDVHTMPPAVATAAIEELDPDMLADRRADASDVRLTEAGHAYGAECLWSVDDRPRVFASAVRKADPDDPEVFRAIARRDAGLGELFPGWDREDRALLRTDGKIPVCARWRTQLEERAIGLDALITASGLAAFSKDQAALDARIRDRIA